MKRGKGLNARIQELNIKPPISVHKKYGEIHVWKPEENMEMMRNMIEIKNTLQTNKITRWSGTDIWRIYIRNMKTDLKWIWLEENNIELTNEKRENTYSGRYQTIDMQEKQGFRTNRSIINVIFIVKYIIWKIARIQFWHSGLRGYNENKQSKQWSN